MLYNAVCILSVLLVLTFLLSRVIWFQNCEGSNIINMPYWPAILTMSLRTFKIGLACVIWNYQADQVCTLFYLPIMWDYSKWFILKRLGALQYFYFSLPYELYLSSAVTIENKLYIASIWTTPEWIIGWLAGTFNLHGVVSVLVVQISYYSFWEIGYFIQHFCHDEYVTSLWLVMFLHY